MNMTRFIFLPALLCVALGSAFAKEDLNAENFTPSPEKADIYAKYLKKIHLSGWWKFKKVSSDRKNDPNDPGTLKKFQLPETDDSGWEYDLVPNNFHSPFVKKTPSNNEKAWGGVAWFRKGFDLPELKKGERVLLTFEEVRGVYSVFVNGKFAGRRDFSMPSGFGSDRGNPDPLEIDATKLVNSGANLVAVRFFHVGGPILWNGGWTPVIGITGPVTIEITPGIRAKHILVSPHDDLKTVTVEAITDGPESVKDDFSKWKGEIFEWNSGKKVAEKIHFSCSGKQKLQAKFTLKNAKTWSPESPFLYGILIRNGNGQTVGCRRFGIRTFKVKGANFLLNGKPFQFRGLVFGDGYPERTRGLVYAFSTNDSGILKKYWQMFRNMKYNILRVREQPSVTYDVFDEIGLLVNAETAYPSIRIQNPSRADHIDVKGYDSASNAKGELLDSFRDSMTKRLLRQYSHPSVCSFSFGNELRDYTPRISTMLNNLYTLFKSLDKQNRPLTSSSGRFWSAGNNVQELLEREKIDYADTHDYTGSISTRPFTGTRPVAEKFCALVQKYAPDGGMPCVNGETVYFVQHYAKSTFDPIWKTKDSAEPDWNKFLFVMNDWYKQNRSHANLGLYWAFKWGTKNYKFDRSGGRALYLERILENQRACWPALDGYLALSGPYFDIPSSLFPFDRENPFKPNAAFDASRRVNEPVFAVPEILPSNAFTGEMLSGEAKFFNNSENDRERLMLEIFPFRDGRIAGERFFATIPSMKTGEVRKIPFRMRLPDTAGEYKLCFRVTPGNTEHFHDRFYPLNLRSRAEVFKDLATTKKVALYDNGSLFKGLGKPSAENLLKAFKIPFTEIRSFDKLSMYDVLIIGPGSIDGKVVDESEAIRAFAGSGKRILVFNQALFGRIPFLPELEYAPAGENPFSEIVRAGHPAMKGMRQSEFFLWNTPDRSVYRYYVRPLSECVITAGGDNSEWGGNTSGMVSSQVKTGKGDIFLIQNELFPTWETDSGAAKFARNILESLLDDSTRSFARPCRGTPLKLKALKSASARTISLKGAANRAFKDKKANDGLDGWSDQGPHNDLAKFIPGEQRIGGIPFEIVDPAANNGKSCVVVSGDPKRVYCPESRPVKVGFALKSLYFLHTGAYTHKGRVGEYVIRHKSGRKQILPIVSGENYSDWWAAPSKKLKDAVCVWSCHNGSGVVGMYIWNWKNPVPDDPVEEIIVRSTTPSVIGLFGLTAEKKI